MSVQNCKVVFLRSANPAYANLREWMKESQHEYVGRRGIVFVEGERFPKTDSPWANPYKITATQDRATVLSLYETYMRKKLEDPEVAKALLALKGKTLGCWCAPEPCHANILLKLIQELDSA
jgi:hypothetical protein